MKAGANTNRYDAGDGYIFMGVAYEKVPSTVKL